MARAFIGLGANLGGGMPALAGQLRAALSRLDGWPGCRVMQVSGAYRSAPVEAEGPDFLNAVAQLETNLAPVQLLEALQAIEADFGRARPFRNAPRTLDLDLLWFDALVQQDERLILPHPRAAQRAFVMLPLAELAPALDWAGQGAVAQLAARIRGQRIERLADPLTPFKA